MDAIQELGNRNIFWNQFTSQSIVIVKVIIKKEIDNHSNSFYIDFNLSSLRFAYDE